MSSTISGAVARDLPPDQAARNRRWMRALGIGAGAGGLRQDGLLTTAIFAACWARWMSRGRLSPSRLPKLRPRRCATGFSASLRGLGKK